MLLGWHKNDITMLVYNCLFIYYLVQYFLTLVTILFIHLYMLFCIFFFKWVWNTQINYKYLFWCVMKNISMLTRVRSSCIKSRQVKYFNAYCMRKDIHVPWFFLLFKFVRNAHLIHTTSEVACVTEILKLSFDHWYVNNLERGFIEHLTDLAI